MKVNEVIELVDELKPNNYTAARKIEWLNRIERQIYENIIMTHEHDGVKELEPYIEESEDELLAPSPYDELYRWYLESQIDISNQEINKYNNSSALFNEAYGAYSNWYNRNHMPLHRCNGYKFRRRV